MGTFIDLQDKIRRYYGFTPSELSGFITSIIILAFIISFREWGKDKFSLATGLFNWFNAALIVTLVFIVFISTQRIVGLNRGYRVEYKMAITGLLIGLLFAFVSRGKIWVLLPGGIIIHFLAGHRLGHFRYDLDFFTYGMIAVSGTVSLVILAAFLKVLNIFFVSDLLKKAILFCIVLAIYDILPIPPMSGNRLYFGSRMVYAFMFSTIITASVLLLLDVNVLIAIIGSVVIGIVCWLVYYISFEQKAWRGPAPKKWSPSEKKKK